jgi:hypothetical protein
VDSVEDHSAEGGVVVVCRELAVGPVDLGLAFTFDLEPDLELAMDCLGSFPFRATRCVVSASGASF